jgi:UTP--glucose-1-phosphate uridylyltransferase
MEKEILNNYKDFLAKYNFNEKLFYLLKKNLNNKTTIDYSSIIPLIPNQIDEHARFKNIGLEAIKKREVGIVILNGGMATRFGEIPKAIQKVYANKTFLELKLKQIKFKNIPIYIMNSFFTENATIKLLNELNYANLPRENFHLFNQSIGIRLDEYGNIFLDSEKKPSFYTLGHGNFIESFKRTNLLSSFIKQHGKYLLISNVDNLFATVDPVILGHHISKEFPITIEIVRKLDNDKGGFPCMVNNKSLILEEFRLPENFDKKTIEFFNTNTFIFSTCLFSNKFDLTYWPVKKVINNNTVIQFEQILSEVSHFNKSNFVLVPREGKNTRFVPVKTQEDLKKNIDFIKKYLA